MERSRTLRTTTRAVTVARAPDDAWDVVASGVDGPQWYVDAAPLVFRGAVDRLLLGPGRRHRPPGRPHLAVADRAGFWEVRVVDHEERRLLLEARVRVPGRVTLEARVTPEAAGSRVALTVALEPHGLLGHTYLLADLAAREALTELTLLHLLTVLRRG